MIRIRFFGPGRAAQYPITKFVEQSCTFQMRQTRKKPQQKPPSTRSTIAGMIREKSCSEEWIGTTRFQILRIQLAEGCTWVDGRPTLFQKTTQPDRVWPEEWSILTKKQKQEEISAWNEKKDQIARCSRARRDLRCFIRRYRIITSRRSPTIEPHSKHACLLQNSSRGMLRETQRHGET